MTEPRVTHTRPVTEFGPPPVAEKDRARPNLVGNCVFVAALVQLQQPNCHYFAENLQALVLTNWLLLTQSERSQIVDQTKHFLALTGRLQTRITCYSETL